ncbi:MAG TPA: 2-oxo-4-hydroxy-4-carboxy-5-ureidoimidazoline decarboxylase [Terracidiphilus sp.]|jgi:OHCU decarboxylase|nr:2-oxo-4-hydroxy-4-carboxy-5-ureidoimidazoline decarboxylase [Terracidiphilus sp.]
MRGNPEGHELVGPGTLGGVLTLLANEPGRWTPIAGGTELMVAHAAGRLDARNLVSLWGIPDLRFIRVLGDSIAIGAGCTFRDLRMDASISADFPLLAQAAGWIGSIANQSRATLGGNLVNGSPAADSSPVLLAYDAEVEIISTRGTRRVPYAEFHIGYKCNVLAADELLYAVHLPRRFAKHKQYLRKVGTRRAMAIAKVALAGRALIEQGLVREIRLGAASVAAYPTRLYRAEDSICGRRITPESIRAARAAAMAEIVPIDDIRSTAEYRRVVMANLVQEFLSGLADAGNASNPVLAQWNTAESEAAKDAILPCCGARRWADAMIAARPIAGEQELHVAADRAWDAMEEADWMEAFACHPRIGERGTSNSTAQTAAWSNQEQASTAAAAEKVLAQLAEENARYENLFGFTYIVSATGKSAEEMLAILHRRLANDRASELREAADQQRTIMHIRLRKWLAQ